MIKLPELFAAKLASTPSLAADVQKSFDLFEPWLEQSGMPFFPGFTDHSPRHINDVLNTAASLISDDSRSILSPEDVAVLSLSILLHDCGMHLTQDGFRALVTDDRPPILRGLGDVPWTQLWADFLGEAQRFGQEKLVAIFGDAEPVQIKTLNLFDLTERDNLLIGEFVRRHHTRLAHEIALNGVPTSGMPLSLVGLDTEIRDIAGLVARSHGMSIRKTFPYIKEHYGLISEYRRIRIPFLMAVLRIADYVQVKSERAIKSLLSVKELRSPISRQEWLNHFAVKDVSVEHDDPEVFYVHATPGDVRTYLKLTSLFKDIQRELDESWATLGEVYGPKKTLSKLGITIRRIRSNLDFAEKFARTVQYVPIKAGFETSGPDLLNLLVGPLYDYEPGIGIRELIQNALDACRELIDLRRNHLLKSEADSEPTIILNVEEDENGTGYVSITDTGVGMTLTTVTRYFLTAGASFRNSDIWKKQHTDEDGESRIIRGGRFGVGALASFLLGEEIHVRTRHVDQPESSGIEFSARMDDPLVELRHCAAPHGTEIRVKISDVTVFEAIRPHIPATYSDASKLAELSYWPAVDWFVQSAPKVICRWNGYNKAPHSSYPNGPRFRIHAEFHPSTGLVPSAKEPEAGWNSLIQPAPYQAILWKYEKKKQSGGDYYGRDEITVNGIRVQTITSYYSYPNKGSHIILLDNEGIGPTYSIRRPSMAIFDPLGICPINLQRSSIAFERMGIEERMAEAVIQFSFEAFKSECPDCKTLLSFKNACDMLHTQSGIDFEGQFAAIAVTSDGVFLASPKSFASLQIKTVFFVDIDWQNDGLTVPLDKLLKKGEALVLRHNQNGTQSSLAWFRGIFSRETTTKFTHSATAGFPLVRVHAQASLMLISRWNFANEKGKVSRQLINSLKNRDISETHTLVTLVESDDTAVEYPLQRMTEILSSLAGESEIAVWSLEDSQPNAYSNSMLHDMWAKVIGDIIYAPRLVKKTGPKNTKHLNLDAARKTGI